MRYSCPNTVVSATCLQRNAAMRMCIAGLGIEPRADALERSKKAWRILHLSDRAPKEVSGHHAQNEA